jgi:hypothetical protein
MDLRLMIYRVYFQRDDTSSSYMVDEKVGRVLDATGGIDYGRSSGCETSRRLAA